jgi:SAM-dependent methyltransferase
MADIADPLSPPVKAKRILCAGGDEMEIHDAARRGFARAPDDYEAGRPGYPAEAVEHLRAAFGLGPGATVVDLAAGTGKLTRALLPWGARILAVEPVAEMRARLPAGVDARAGTAEAMPVGDAEADAVLVGQAFHWFDGPRALAEIRRVLKPRGGLGLVWNTYAPEWGRRVDPITTPYRGDAPRFSLGTWRHAFDATDTFDPLAEATFTYRHATSLDAYLSRVASVSYVSALPDAERARVLEAVRAAVAHVDPFVVPYVTRVYTTRAR